MAGPSVPQLYRRILIAARTFPSVRREAMVESIKEEFHANKSLSDPAAIEEATELAFKGLQQLHSYTSLASDAPNWEIDLERNPFGCRPDNEE